MNLFDVEHENGPLMREKPRAATETEAKAYVTWLRERRGLRLFDNVELHSRGIGGGRNSHLVYWAATFGKCLKPSRWEGDVRTAPEYQEGAYSILIPGHDQLAPRVTMETLDESGEVVASQTLPVEPKKGGVIWDKAAVRKACGHGGAGRAGRAGPALHGRPVRWSCLPCDAGRGSVEAAGGRITPTGDERGVGRESYPLSVKPRMGYLVRAGIARPGHLTEHRKGSGNAACTTGFRLAGARPAPWDDGGNQIRRVQMPAVQGH